MKNLNSDELQIFMNTTTDLVTRVDSSGIFLYVNKASNDFLGLTPKETIGRKFEEFIHADDRESTTQEFNRWLEQKLTKVNFENRQISTTGEIRNVLWSCNLRYDENQNFIEVWSTARDITDIKKAEEERNETMIHLERSNRDLEQFAYVASHDLQEPLRMVSSFLQLLNKRYGDTFNEEAKEFINFSVDGAQRMQALINDLLHFSRIGTRNQIIELVDLNEIIKTVVWNLTNYIEENNAEIKIDSLPEKVFGNEIQLVQLFQNLISNGIKFKNTKSPLIEINFKDSKNFYKFSVKDNGIGIDPKYFDRVFIIFQRLHNRGQYEGTGMGLSISKKIIERHGKKIWINSKINKGTTINFTISKKLQKNIKSRKKKS